MHRKGIPMSCFTLYGYDMWRWSGGGDLGSEKDGGVQL